LFQDGAILIFLPGWAQITKLHDLIMKNPVFQSGISIDISTHLYTHF